MRRIYLIGTLVLIVSLGFAVFLKIENARLKRVIVHQATVAQMDAISARAQAFMEVHYDSKFVSGGSSMRSMRHYERTLNIPDEKKDEFTRWMAGYSLEAVAFDGFPSDWGSDLDGDDKQLVYRVYYGDEPTEWKKEN